MQQIKELKQQCLIEKALLWKPEELVYMVYMVDVAYYGLHVLCGFYGYIEAYIYIYMYEELLCSM